VPIVGFDRRLLLLRESVVDADLKAALVEAESLGATLGKTQPPAGGDERVALDY
jgi:hypothetical protein